MDRFKYKNEGESPEEFSTCANPNCKATIFKDDSYINYYGSVCCESLHCLIAVTDSRKCIAGEDD